jgi:hypothetical protein
MMICDDCRGKFEALHQTYYGDFCQNCIKGSDERGRQYFDELLAEPVLSMPPMLKLEDFERVMLKFTLHYLKSLPEGERQRLRGTIPTLLQPMKMLLHLKDLVIDQIPLNYVSSMNVEGANRMHHGATYEFKRLVPDTVVIKALVAAGIADPKAEP